MPFLTHCHECDKPTANAHGMCDKCQESYIEPTTADEYNAQWLNHTLVISKKGEKDMIQLDKIEDIVFSGIDNEDYPDYSDAFVESATYHGREMSQDELEDLMENYPEWVYNQLMEYEPWSE